MAKQITFIKRKSEEKTVDGEIVVRTRNWKRAELIELLRNESDLFFSVPEAHATSVLIPQGKHQEVYEDIIEEAKKPAPKPAGGNNGGGNSRPKSGSNQNRG